MLQKRSGKERSAAKTQQKGQNEMKNFLSQTAYDVLKAIVMYVLPPLATLYFALSGIWGLPYGEQVVGTITAVTTCLSVMLGISSQQYRNNISNIQELAKIETTDEGE